MSLRDTLSQSIAALERLTSTTLDAESEKLAYSPAPQTPVESQSEKDFRSHCSQADMDRLEVRLDVTRVVHALYTCADAATWPLPFMTAAPLLDPSNLRRT